MYDHLIKFDTEAHAIADPVIGKYYVPPRTGRAGEPDFPGGWRADVCFKTQVYTVTGQETVTVPDHSGGTQTVVRDVRAYSTDFYVWISTTTDDQDMANVPACILTRNRDAAVGTDPFVTKSLVQLADLPAMRIEPVIAGSAYPHTEDDWANVPSDAVVTEAVLAADTFSAKPLLEAVALPPDTVLRTVSMGLAKSLGGGKLIKA